MAAGNDCRKAKTAHVNMMTDTIINSISADGLRVIMRSLLGAHPEITSTFEDETRRYICDVTLRKKQPAIADAETLKATQRTIRCMQGCGLGTQSIHLMGTLALEALELPEDESYGEFLASIDGDCVQLITAIEKGLLAAGLTTQPVKDKKLIEGLRQSLVECWNITKLRDLDYPYVRALTATSILLGAPIPQLNDGTANAQPGLQVEPSEMRETFQLNGRRLPRIFSGLWQMSSPSWGSAPTPKIIAQFSKYVSAGMVAFDMADHYGDAELLFVSPDAGLKGGNVAKSDRVASTQHIPRTP